MTAQLGKSSGTEDEESKTLNVGVAVGGAGGDGGFGNTVTVTNDGAVTAMGTAATGIFAQSVGGGGGDGGGGVNGVGMLTDSANQSSRSVVADVTIGGNGGDGNYGGEVVVTNTGKVMTGGDSGHGIQAQSVGGGGGVGGRANTYQVIITKPEEGQTANKNNLSLAATIGGNGGTGSHGGKVTVDNSGEIETSGDTAHGIYAQSVGGGGGDGGNGTVGLGGILNLKGADSIITSKYGSLKTYKNIQVADRRATAGWSISTIPATSRRMARTRSPFWRSPWAAAAVSAAPACRARPGCWGSAAQAARPATAEL